MRKEHRIAGLAVIGGLCFGALSTELFKKSRTFSPKSLDDYISKRNHRREELDSVNQSIEKKSRFR